MTPSKLRRLALAEVGPVLTESEHCSPAVLIQKLCQLPDAKAVPAKELGLCKEGVVLFPSFVVKLGCVAVAEARTYKKVPSAVKRCLLATVEIAEGVTAQERVTTFGHWRGWSFQKDTMDDRPSDEMMSNREWVQVSEWAQEVVKAQLAVGKAAPGDLHAGNVGVDSHGRPRLLDFPVVYKTDTVWKTF